MRLRRADILMPHHLGRHGHGNVAVHHGLDKEAAERLGADWPADGLTPRLIEIEPEAALGDLRASPRLCG